MNKNYLKGRRLEYEIIKRINDSGGISIRSAGSKGVIDIVGFFPKMNLINLIQAKNGKPVLKKSEKERITELYEMFKYSEIPVQFILVFKDKGKIAQTTIWETTNVSWNLAKGE